MSQQTYYPYPQPAPAAPQRGSSAGKIVGIVVAALVVLAGIAAGALFLFGKPVLDEAKVQAEIVRITRDASGGLEPTNVVCPKDVPIKAGSVSICTAQLDGQPVSYTVRQDDDKGNVHITSSGFIVTDPIEKTLADRVSKQVGTPVTAECANGKKVVVGGKGTTIGCTVTNAADPTDTLQVTATVTDDQGTVDFS